MQVRSIIELWNPNTGVWEASTVGGPNVNVGNDINVSNFPAAINDPTIKYKISDIDTVVQENQYFGYVASDGTWYIMNLTATGAGPYFWCVSTGQLACTGGLVPYNRKTLAAAGSFAKGYFGAALGGLVGSMVVMCGSALGGGSAQGASFIASAIAMQAQMVASVENIDGSIIVPPGGVLALMCANTPVAHSVSSSLMWAEVPV